MKTFQISNGETGDRAALDPETIRALQSITRAKCGGPAQDAAEQAMHDTALSWEQLELLRKLETEFAREIAEFKASRRPMRETINDETPAAI